MKKIISLLLIVLFAITAYPTQASADSFPSGRVTAVGGDPNDKPSEEGISQAGVTVLGAGPQIPTCPTCQTTPVLLSSSGRNAGPGVAGSNGVTPAKGVDTGN